MEKPDLRKQIDESLARLRTMRDELRLRGVGASVAGSLSVSITTSRRLRAGLAARVSPVGSSAELFRRRGWRVERRLGVESSCSQ